MFRDRMLSAGFATSALVSAVLMATLVVGPFYLSGALGLDAARVGIVMSAGPLVAALTGVPAGRIVDRLGAQRMTIVGLAGIAAGSFMLSVMPASFGIPGYIVPIVLITASYALFQTANNTAVMTDIPQDQRGVISGVLNLSRNLGLVTGASVMGAVFALASASIDITMAQPEAVATGMRVTFAVAADADRVRARHRDCEPRITGPRLITRAVSAAGWSRPSGTCRPNARPDGLRGSPTRQAIVRAACRPR